MKSLTGDMPGKVTAIDMSLQEKIRIEAARSVRLDHEATVRSRWERPIRPSTVVTIQPKSLKPKPFISNNPILSPKSTDINSNQPKFKPSKLHQTSAQEEAPKLDPITDAWARILRSNVPDIPTKIKTPGLKKTLSALEYNAITERLFTKHTKASKAKVKSIAENDKSSSSKQSTPRASSVKVRPKTAPVSRRVVQSMVKKDGNKSSSSTAVTNKQVKIKKKQITTPEKEPESSKLPFSPRNDENVESTLKSNSPRTSESVEKSTLFMTDALLSETDQVLSPPSPEKVKIVDQNPEDTETADLLAAQIEAMNAAIESENNRLRLQSAEKNFQNSVNKKNFENIEKEESELKKERLAAETAEAERLEAQKLERLAAEQAEAERLEAQNIERPVAEKAEAERLAAEETERLVAEKAEAERLAAEKKEAERLAKEKEEAERIEKEKAEKLAAEKLEAERLAAEKEEQERIEKEKAETERLEKLEQIRIREQMDAEQKLEEAKRKKELELEERRKKDEAERQARKNRLSSILAGRVNKRSTLNPVAENNSVNLVVQEPQQLFSASPIREESNISTATLTALPSNDEPSSAASMFLRNLSKNTTSSTTSDESRGLFDSIASANYQNNVNSNGYSSF